MIDTKSINNVIQKWLNNGTEITEEGLPVYPEYVYRTTGEWKGWNNFLGIRCSDNEHEYIENELNDELEDIAFYKLHKGTIPLSLISKFN